MWPLTSNDFKDQTFLSFSFYSLEGTLYGAYASYFMDRIRMRVSLLSIEERFKHCFPGYGGAPGAGE